jgi:hypothetical protein
MNWGGLVGGLLGGVGSYAGAKESNKDAGKVDITHTNDPWAPSLPYRQTAMDEALAALRGGRPAAPSPAPPTGGASGLRNVSMAGKAPAPAPGVGRVNKRGEFVPYKPTAAGAGSASPAAAPANSPAGSGPWTGESTQTRKAFDALAARAEAGDPLYGAASDYQERLLSGDPERDPNAYRGETADMLRDLDDPDLKRFKEMLFSQVGSGGGRSSGAGLAQYGPGTRVNADGTAIGTRTPAGGDGTGPVGVVDDIQEILDGKYLEEGNPHRQKLVDAATAQSGRALDDRLKQNRLRAAGSGMYGGTPYQNIEGRALTDYGKEVGEVTGAIEAADYNARMADVMQALGVGAGYDTAYLDRAASERMSNASLSASAGSAEAGRQTQLELARLGALSGAVGMGLDQGQFRASGMGALAGQYGGEQQGALGLVDEITGLPIRDWGAAGQLSLGSDSNRNQLAGINASRAVGMAGVGATNKRLDFDRERYAHEAPLNDIGRFMDIISSASGGGGTSREVGLDRRSASPSNIWGQTASGAAGGYALGSDIYGR